MCIARGSRSPSCCRPAANIRSNRRCRSCPAARSPALFAACPPVRGAPASCALGGFAETAVAPSFLTFALPAALDFAQGAALILNYHTVYFSLVQRGRL